MTRVVRQRKLLEGEAVAFTGRLASMSRSEAARLVVEQGGRFAANITAGVSMLVIGREGWPLDADGRLTKKIRQARAMMRAGKPLAIVPEEKFLARLSIGGPQALTTRCDMAQLTALLGVSRQRIQKWIDGDLVQPAEVIEGIAYFDFAHVSGAKRLCELTEKGVTVDRLKRSLRQLSTWLRSELPLGDIALLENSRQLLVRLKDGQLAEPHGQLQIEFAEQPPGMPAVTMGEFRSAEFKSAERWFDEGFELEQQGEWQRAAESYRQALLLGGPPAECCFNLANVLYAAGEKQAAAERFRQVVEADPANCDAWNNLATVLIDLGKTNEAVSAYRRAIEINPTCAEAHYNLADTLDSLKRPDEARPHWTAYLRLESAGRWAQYAQTRLRAAGR